MTNKNDVFVFSNVDVSKYVQKKMGLSYLNWAFVVDTLKSKDPKSTYSVKAFPEMNLKTGQLTGRKVNYFMGINGNDAYVEVTVTFRNQSHTEMLPCYDFKGNAVKVPDAMLVNKTIKRCYVKAAAMLTGLGIHLYIDGTTGDGNNARNNGNYGYRRSYSNDYHRGNSSSNYQQSSPEQKKQAMMQKSISNGQIKFIRNLCGEVDLTKLNEKQRKVYAWANSKTDWTNVNMFTASAAIQRLENAPKKPKRQSSDSAVDKTKRDAVGNF